MRALSSRSLLAVALASSPLVVMAGLASCQSTTPPVFVHMGRVGQRADMEVGEPVAFDRINQSDREGHKPGFYVLRSTQDWDVFFADHKAHPRPGAIDFARTMVVTAYSGDANATNLDVTNVVRTPSALHVYVRQGIPGQGCPDKVDHQASEIVAVPRLDKPVHVHVDTVEGEACKFEPPLADVGCYVPPASHPEEKITAPLGATIVCEGKVKAGSSAVVDRDWALLEAPKGSAAKLTFLPGNMRASFDADAIGRYKLSLEATDEGTRKHIDEATVEVTVPSNDTFIELVWSNFTAADDPSTFPHVEIHAEEAPKGGPKGKDCNSSTSEHPPFCDVTKLGAITLMRLHKGTPQRYAVRAVYLDERKDNGPIACVRVFSNGALTNESCDAVVRAKGAIWDLGNLDEATGGYDVPGGADGGAGDGGSGDGGAKAAKTKTAKAAAPNPKTDGGT